MIRFKPLFCLLHGFSLFVLLTAPTLSFGEIFTIDEDFSTTARRDGLMTSALWDTTVLNVHLHSRVLFSRGSLNTTSAYASARGPSHLFLADGTSGLRSINTDDPDNPLSTDLIQCDDQAKGVALSGTHAYVAVGSAGLQVIDVSNPSAMVDLGSYDNDDGLRYVNAVAVHEPAVYLAESDSGVAVFDITDPSVPVFVRHLDTGSWARDVFVSGSHLYVADDGLQIFDISNPFNPVLVSQPEITGTSLRVNVVSGRAFVACGSSGLQVFDISDPADPVALATIDDWGSCQHATATSSGDTIFVAAGVEGLFVLDATDPDAIETLGNRDTIQVALHVMYHNSLIHLSNSSDGLKIYEIDPDGLDPLNNRAQSINLNDTGEPVSRISLSASNRGSVSYEVTADGGDTWFELEPGSGWFELPDTGTDVRWRAFLVQTEGGPAEGPACYSISLTLDRLSNFAAISAVGDVPDDAGGQVRLSWLASRFDAPGAEHQVTEYSIFRRYQGEALKAGNPEPAYPPGQWDFITTIPADMENQYAAVVPTLADSSSSGIPWAVFFVRTRTTETGVFFDSPPDSGYSVNNLQPDPPTGLFVDYSPALGTQLNWNSSSNPDFAHFRIYRSSQADTPIQPATLFAVTTDTEFFDETLTHWYYQLTLVTVDGQESAPAYHLSPVPDNQAHIQLLPNTPNPFNPSTEFSFLVGPGGESVSLDIFDFRGRKITTLLNQSLPSGWHTVNWNGREQTGRTCASGVYHARLRQGAHSRVVKMTLVR